MTGPKPPGQLPRRSLPSFNKKELELLLLEQVAQLQAMRSLLVNLNLVSEHEFDFLVKKANEQVMERLSREGLFKTVQVFPEGAATSSLLPEEEEDSKKR